MRFANLKMLKVLTLVGLMSAITAAISYVSVEQISALSRDTDEIELAGQEALMGARAGQSVLILSGSEFRIAADPSATEVAEVERIILEQRKQFETYIADLKVQGEHAAHPAA